MIRFVTAPDGAVAPDIAQILPGRGIWVGADRELVNTACRRRILSRGGRVPEDLAGQCEALLTAHALALLGLGRRAGQLVLGARAVRAALKAGDAAVLVQARDAAPGGRAKLERLRTAAAPDCAAVNLFTRAELAAGTGRDVTHIAMQPGGLAARFRATADRLGGFRSAPNGAGQGSSEQYE